MNRTTRLIAFAGMAAVAAAVGTVTYQASAAENPAATADSAAPAALAAPDALAVAPGGQAVGIPAIASPIRPPAGARPVGAYLVTSGTQNYTCAATGTFSDPSVPEAQLLGTGGRLHHFGGPSWQSERDGSLVTATKVAASDRTGAIPELLLKVATHTGSGVLSRADYINRLYTSGGVAPTGPCTAGQKAAVPYKAVYVFWSSRS